MRSEGLGAICLRPVNAGEEPGSQGRCLPPKPRFPCDHLQPRVQMKMIGEDTDIQKRVNIYMLLRSRLCQSRKVKCSEWKGGFTCFHVIRLMSRVQVQLDCRSFAFTGMKLGNVMSL